MTEPTYSTLSNESDYSRFCVDGETAIRNPYADGPTLDVSSPRAERTLDAPGRYSQSTSAQCLVN